MKSQPDTLLFLFIFAIGFLAIFTFNVVPDFNYEQRDSWGIAARVIFPCLLIIAYAFIVWLVPKFMLSSVQAGDNCYYLGFIFTLVSLAFALHDFVGGDDDSRKQIVQDFGIALSTTIAGLLLRVLFAQSRLDPTRVEEATRKELSKRARELRDELDRAALDFRNFRRNLKQSLESALVENQAAIHALHTQIVENHLQTTEKWSDSMSAIGEKFTQRHQNLNQNLKNLSTELEQLTAGVRANSDALDGTRGTFKKVNANLEKLNAQVSKLCEVMDDELVDKLISFNCDLSSVRATIETNKVPLNDSVELFKNFISELNQLDSVLKKLANHADENNLKSRNSWLKKLGWRSKPE